MRGSRTRWPIFKLAEPSALSLSPISSPRPAAGGPMFRRLLLRRFLFPPRPFSTCRRKRSPPLPHADPPIPKKIPFAVSAHGRTWEDPYRWMSDTADPDLADHLLSENLYAEAFMSDAEGLRRTLAAEMRARMPPRISTPPEALGNWLYYQYIPEGKEYPVLCRRPRMPYGVTKALLHWLRGCGDEEVLLDWNEIAERFGYVHIGSCRISPNHRFIAYTLDTSGSEKFMLQVKDLQTGQITSNSRRKGVVSLAWTGDSSCLLYTLCNENQRPYRVFSTNLGSNVIDDLLFTENDSSCCVDITSTKDGKYVTINSNSRFSSEVYVVDAMNLKDGIWPVRKRVPGVQYFLEHHYGFFYILTNAPSEDMGSAANGYYLVRCAADKSLLADWQVVIKLDQDMTFRDMDIFNEHLVLSVETEGLLSFCSLEMHMFANQKKPMEIEDIKPWFFPLPTSPCSIVPGSNLDFMSSVYRVVISSPVIPDLVVDYDLKRCNFSILHQEEVLGLINNSNSSDLRHHSPGNQTLNKQHFYTVKSLKNWGDLSEEFFCERRDVISHDGTLVPLTIVYSRRKDHIGQSPGILHGYGAYGDLLDKSFCSDNLTLLARGWVFAYADVRGGGEDLAWHEAGTRSHKLNSIYDFAACAMFLINEGYVHKSQLGAIGCSAGGLLVGATINMFPDLFSAAILKVPFLDICTTLLNPSLPLTSLDYDEFGDPRNKTDFETIQSYSPYDNICSDVCYPSLLVTASFRDSRVGVWEAAKWVARVREKTCGACSRSVILKTNMTGGHFGEGGRFIRCEDVAFEYAFFMKTMGSLDDVKKSQVC